ncbi:LemA family protein [Alteribacillus sp. HJP-4]|uniref:LemA family protein n=1 Tax=Alteribacillus sp. HJP-4 TaxID=2775394 RepID=UPI0035CD257A
MTFFGAVLGIIIVIAIAGWIIGYNALIKYLHWVEEAWAYLDSLLKRRYDHVPQLVEIMQAEVRTEQHTLERAIELRSQLMSSNNSRKQKLQINNELSKVLKQIISVKNEVKELKENPSFLELESQIQETDEKISKASKMYNNTVAKYNAKISSAPTNFVANAHNFHERESLEEARAVTSGMKATS